MQVSYSYLDPSTARSSIIIEFAAPPNNLPHKDSPAGVRNLQSGAATTPTRTRILVDPGSGVTPRCVNKAVPALDAILLTHAHYDHIENLPGIVDRFPDTPIYASAKTTALLATLGSLETQPFSHTIADIQDRCQNPADWETLNEEVKLTGVPAGHTPGAIGFYIEAESVTTPDPISIYVTGDFTRSDVAGTPGAIPISADILCLTTSTADTYGTALTDGLENTLEYARSQQQTVVMSTSLGGAQVTQLLASFIDASDLGLTIAAGGAVAKTLAALDITPPHTTLVEEYEPRSLLEQADITITAPAAPGAEKSSSGAAKLYEQVKDNQMAAVVRFCGRHSTFHESLCDATCLTESHLVTGHPTEETLAEFIEEVAPGTVVTMHQTGDAFHQRRDMWRRVVFAPPSNGPHVLFDGDELTLPGPLSLKHTHALKLPDNCAITRRDHSPADCTYTHDDCIDPDAEAVDTTRIRNRFSSPDTNSDPEREPAGASGPSETVADTGNTGADSQVEESASSPPTTVSSPPPAAANSARVTSSDATHEAESTGQTHQAKYCTDSEQPLVADGAADPSSDRRSSSGSVASPADQEAQPANSTDQSESTDRIHDGLDTIAEAVSDLRTATDHCADESISISTVTTTQGVIKQTLDDRLVIQLEMGPQELSESNANPADISLEDEITVHLSHRESNTDGSNDD